MSRNSYCLHLFFVGGGGVPQGAKLGLKFGVGIDDDFQHFAQIGFAVDKGIDVFVQFVVNVEEVLQAVVRCQASVGGLGIGPCLLEGSQPGSGKRRHTV